MSPRSTTLISYAVFLFVMAAVGCLHLSAACLTVLFACLALHKLNFWNRKWLSVLLFLILVALVVSGFVLFLRTAILFLPGIVRDSIRDIVKFAGDHDIELPFADNLDSFKDLAVDTVRSNLSYLQNFATVATKEFVFQLISVVVAIGIFLNPALGTSGVGQKHPTLYDLLYEAITDRFASFYWSFERVMGAQFLISLINTVFTSVFVLICCLCYPKLANYSGMILILTFACGMLPIIGNVLSNSIIVGLAFTVSPKLAIFGLVFLVAIHKLEYFLNSKIIGDRIRHPMWLMLLALLIGERLLGIPGIILAPVVLCFIKVELTKYEVDPESGVVKI